MKVLILVTICIGLNLACIFDVSITEYRAIYCMYLVMLVRVSIELYTACNWRF